MTAIMSIAINGGIECAGSMDILMNELLEWLDRQVASAKADARHALETNKDAGYWASNGRVAAYEHVARYIREHIGGNG